MTFIPVWPAYLDYLRTALIARAGLAGVNISTAPLGDDAGLESIQFGNIEDDTEWGLIGNYRVDSTFTITGYILIAKPGAGEAVIKAARDRAVAIYAELLDALYDANRDAAAPARASLVSSATVDQLIWGSGERTCDIQFRLTAQAEIEH